MIETVRTFLTNILKSLYTPFLFAIVLAVCILFFVMYTNKYKDLGWSRRIINSIKDGKNKFLRENAFRRFFYFSFIVVLILFKTLLNREMWINPVANVIGTWSFHKKDGTFTTEIIENVILFIPLILFLFLFLETTSKKVTNFLSIMGRAILISFFFSFSIEMFQLFLRLGTWQLSDICFNTIGGMVGGIIYYLSVVVRRRV